MKTRVRTALIVVLFATAGLCAVQPQTIVPTKPFVGKVVGVADGDTISVLFQGQAVKVRLETIDAPESTQDFGLKAKEVLAAKIDGKEVKVVWKSKDKYGRIRGEVYLEERRLCLEMVAEGYAWHYVQFSKDDQLAKAEKEAREARRGLWAGANPMPPWEFRKRMGFEQEAEPARVLVYVTRSGEKYHKKGCRSLSKSEMELTLEDAIQRKYVPCSVCKPPVVGGSAKK